MKTLYPGISLLWSAMQIIALLHIIANAQIARLSVTIVLVLKIPVKMLEILNCILQHRVT